MNLLDIVRRTSTPEPWSEGEKIPWDDPAFSERMLKEHLSQQHDAASRRSSVVDAHVDWIHNAVLAREPGSILDLGCGPGLYTSRLSRLGHRCLGIDFSPAAIAYATEFADEQHLDCRYIQGDIRSNDFGIGHDLVMLIFGEFNVFRTDDARDILIRARQALKPGGLLLLEAHTLDAVRAIGNEPASWQAVESGLFSDGPHLRLDESIWDETNQVATSRYYVIDTETSTVTRHASSMQGYATDQYRELIEDCGFVLCDSLGTLTGDDRSDDFVVLLASAQ